eukprot:5588625-Pyramimonas_sp.AAC.1
MRAAVNTFPEYRKLLDQLSEFASRHLEIVDFSAGKLSPSFWQSPAFVEHLSDAAGGFSRSQDLARVGSIA